ncbi:MAG: aminotransferase class I/II-fold pyridoxal phosphate-dependent enzyme [Methanoregulaceae archaeon]|nr:aminotransferase class I/II-fold pyridoxal phosphate-dependent enzyme [Methanoregulaceae archaeon]
MVIGKDGSGKRYDHLVRDCFRSGGYVFAGKAGDIARKEGITRVARLGSNENPNPPSPGAIRLGSTALNEANRYPDETLDLLVQCLSRTYGPYDFITGVGMDGVIETLIRTLVSPGDRVAVATPTFSFYGLAGMAQSAEVVPVGRNKDYSVDPGLFIDAAGNAKISFLCSPNNPTGTITPFKDVTEILSGIDGVLFLDNAYVEFCDVDYLPLMKDYENLVIGRTMSKAYALAGARVGYAFAPAWLLPYFRRASTPFTLNSVSARAAIGALEDRGSMEAYVRHVRLWRERYVMECGFPVAPSGANFIMADVSPWTGDAMVRELAVRGVIVRSCASFPGLPDHFIRVSVGADWENELFLKEIRSIREAGSGLTARKQGAP